MTGINTWMRLWLVLLVGAMGSTALAAMQTPAPPSAGAGGTPPTLSELSADPAAGQQLVARMNDEQVRRLVLDELARSAQPSMQHPAAQGTRSVLDRIEASVGLAMHRLQATILDAPQIPAELSRALNRLTDGGGAGRLMAMAGLSALLIAIGWVVELWLRRWSGSFRQRIEEAPAMTPTQRLGAALLRLVLDLVYLALFAATASLLFALSTGGGAGAPRLLFMACLLAVLCGRLTSLVSRSLLAPGSGQMRLIPLADESAHTLHRSLTALGHYVGWSYLFVKLIARLEVSNSTRVAFSLVLGSILLGWIALALWNRREAVSRAIAGPGPGPDEARLWVRQRFAELWHVLALAYIAGIWLVWSAQVLTADGVKFRGTLIASLLIVPIYLLLNGIGQWLVTRFLESGRDQRQPAGTDGPPHPLTDAPAPAAAVYGRWMRAGVRGLILLILVLWLLELFGLSLPFIDVLKRAGFTILVVVAVAQFTWRVVNGLIQRKMEELAPLQPPEGEEIDEEAGGGGLVTDRRYTLLPVLRTFVATTLIVMVILIVLSSLGVDIGPLLAGAGVVGLALGFGAQKLVRDILSGMFFLIDDAFRVGEYIATGSTDGTVEQITLRYLKLRTPKGTLQLIPYSEVGSVTNFMRGALIEKLTLNLPYDTDIETVRKVVKKVGQSLLADEQLGPHIVRPLKSQGVKSVADSVMSFQAKFSAKPGKQYMVKREAFKRLQIELEKKGIHFAHRKVIVEFPGGTGEQANSTPLGGSAGPPAGAPPPTALAGAAAIQTILDQEHAAAEKKAAKT
jgi:small-conductance mechanosensitive channel